MLKNSSKINNNEYNFNFEANIKKINNIYKIEVVGRHYSKNVIQNQWHRGILLRYKKSIKEAMIKAFDIIKNSGDMPILPLNKVKIEVEIYNPKSRDDDANYDNIKIIRDTLTINGLIKDDNREVILESSEKEIISKKWKIIFIVENLNENH